MLNGGRKLSEYVIPAKRNMLVTLSKQFQVAPLKQLAAMTISSNLLYFGSSPFLTQKKNEPSKKWFVRTVAILGSFRYT